MKKVLILFLATIFSLSLFALDFSINLIDSYGDGWNGGMVDVTVAGTLVLDDITVETGTDASYTFAVNDGDEVIVAYTPGQWSEENSYTIANEEGVVIYTSTAPPAAVYSFIVGAFEAPNVFFSEYIEGSSNNKAIEIYNGTDDVIDLVNYRINQSNNGNDWEYIHTFPEGAILEPGDVWVIAADQLDPELFPLGLCDEVLSYPSVVHFNGNDARGLEVFANGEWNLIDVIGIPTSDANWDVAGVTEGTKNHTIVRKDAIISGNTDWTASAGTNADDSEWIVYDQNTFDYLGWHLEEPAYVAGTVTIDALGDVTGTIITIGEVVTSPAEDGTYIAQVEPGTYTVEAYLSGYEMASQADVVCTAGELAIVDFALNVIPEDLWPPVNLTAEIAGNNVEVAWTAPTQYGWNGYYDGPASLTWAGPERSVYFDVTDFGFSYPMELSAISHAFYEHSAYPWGDDTTFMFKIYGADGTTVLYESDVMTALTQWDDTLLELDTPITVTENFYVSVVPTGESGFPSSLFDSDVENLHGYVGSPGAWGDAYADFATMVYIVGEDGPEVLSYRKDVKNTNKISSNLLRATKRINSVKIDERAPITENRDLLSFNVFRDDVQINTTPVYDVSFTDIDVPAGTHSYYATAVWNSGESGPSNVATVDLSFGNLAGNVSDGSGVEGAVITAGGYSATTDENGDFLIENMLAGSYDVSCSAVGYDNPETQTVEILAGETTTVNFVLESSEGTIAFFDDFESGADNWTFDEGSTWGITEEGAHSPTHSMTESPNANYAANQNISATLATPWDLSGVFGAELSFWYKSDIETGFDFMSLEVSIDGENWEQLAMYDEEDGDWQEETIPMGGFVGAGYESVSIRFRFNSDGGYETVGMLIDDITLTTYETDLFEPFISHAGPAFYEGTQEDYEFTATIIDISGIAEANVVYTVDGGEEISAPYTSVDGNEYTFVIPAQDAGAEVDYSIQAIDAAATANTALKGVYSYIAGTHFIYDNGVVDFYTVINEGAGVAEKIINPPGNQLNLAYALIRNYTDQSGQDNDDFEFHVWADNNGLPGEDIITPFVVSPEATYDNTSAMTRIDLRPFADELNNIQGNFYIGFLVNQEGEFGKVHCTLTDPGNYANSYAWNGAEWAMLDGKDLHFRAVAELIEVSTGMVEGVVTNVNGESIEGALVSVGTAQATTDASGYYTLVADPGIQDVVVHADSYIDYTGSIEVIPNDTVELNVELDIILWAPVNLTYEYIDPNVILHWEEPVGPAATEFRYDDGTATAQLGFGDNEAAVLGGAHFYNAVIEEVTWMLTSNAPHAEAKILIFGLDDAGVPDDSQLLHESELLPNIDDQWNTYTLETPVEAPNGFFVGVCTPGVFTAIGTDDGVGAPYEFQEGTQWGIADYTAGTNEWLDVGPAGFPFNFTVRAIGQNNGEINYERTASTNVINSSKLKYSELSTGIELGLPVYNNYEIGSYTQTRNTRSLAGYNIYRNDIQLNDAPHSSLIYVDTEPIEDCTYYITAVYEDPDGESEPSNSVTINEISADDDLVLATELQGNYPNPFNPTTTINFSLLNPGKVNLKIYNAKGQVVRTLLDEEMESANYQITWNGTDDNNKKVSSGIYFYRMSTKGYSSTKKMMLLK